MDVEGSKIKGGLEEGTRMWCNKVKGVWEWEVGKGRGVC